MKRFVSVILVSLFVIVSLGYGYAAELEGKHKAEMDEMQKKFHWWPTDAKPNPVKGVVGGIVDKDMPIHISNVLLYNPASQKADRVGFKLLEDGTKVRVFRSTGEVVGA